MGDRFCPFKLQQQPTLSSLAMKWIQSFRRSLATHLYDAGVPLRQTMEITGHASLASLTSYLNLEKRAAGDAQLNLFAN